MMQTFNEIQVEEPARPQIPAQHHPMLQTFAQVQVDEEQESAQAFGLGAAIAPDKAREESQSWKPEDLLEFLHDEESDHPNVFTEEVTNDRRMLD